MSNKQPFYHQATLETNAEILRAIKRIKTVIKSSVEIFEDELTFTATSNVSYEANEILKKFKHVKLLHPVEAEAGDPADLMQLKRAGAAWK